MNFIKQTLYNFFLRTHTVSPIENLYWEIVSVSRNPEIYRKFAIPDTLDGRFDCLMLHLFLVINHLQTIHDKKISDTLLAFFIKDMDRSLRETGVGDPSISRKMRKIGEAYLGRINAYGIALNNYQDLFHALHKNMYRKSDISEHYVRLLTDYVLNYKKILLNYKPFEQLPKGILD